jgi:hypothetical protein
MDLATAMIFSYTSTIGLFATVYVYTEIKKYIIKKCYD